MCAALSIGSTALAESHFVDVTSEIGVILPSSRGTAFGDYDNDDWPDLLVAESTYAPSTSGRLILLHNERNGRFAVAAGALPEEVAYPTAGVPHKGGGVVFGDYDHDGDLDVFVPVGAFRGDHAALNALLRNDRGVYRDVAVQAGLVDSCPTDNAIWLDYDRDGRLDLYAGNISCWAEGADPTPGAYNRLYRNLGDGTFADVTAEAGLLVEIAAPRHTGLTCCCGSNGGMAAPDFDGDGWPDLYVGAYGSPNRMFRNEEGERLMETTTEVVSQPITRSWGMAVGDVDGDGDMDIVQSSRVTVAPGRPGLLLNLGGGAFREATEWAGLTRLWEEDVLTVGLGDIDNDGHLDLLAAGGAPLLFINRGDGTFFNTTEESGLTNGELGVAMADYNRDGFLDVLYGSGKTFGAHGTLYRNVGNDNHWLRVELVGKESNRNGVGARLTARAGDLEQVREVLGGMGFYQHEFIAHFGMGDRELVDELVVRWPSGQVDVVYDVPVDRQIRLIEGAGTHYVAAPTEWMEGPALPDSVAAGEEVELQGRLRPGLYMPGAEVTRVSADLRSLGGPSAVPLAANGDGTYALAARFVAERPAPIQELVLVIEQATDLGPRWTRFSTGIAGSAQMGPVDAVPETRGWSGDVSLTESLSDFSFAVYYSRGISARVDSAEGLAYVEPYYRVFTASSVPWAVSLRPQWSRWERGAGIVDYDIRVGGFSAIRFALYFEAAAGNELYLTLNEQVDIGSPETFLSAGRAAGVSLLDGGIDLRAAGWQEVVIPLERFPSFDGEARFVSIGFAGDVEGRFYLDDVRLLAQLPITAVQQASEAFPATFHLYQNYPNPFNAATVVRFSLPESGQVDLAVFDLLGRRVRTLAVGWLGQGGHLVRWDGRDDHGRRLASGVFFCSLRYGSQRSVMKLLLLE